MGKVTIVHIARSERNEGIVDPGQGTKCNQEDCPGPKGWETGFGLAGGGFGEYNYCPVCERVKEKSIIPEDQE